MPELPEVEIIKIGLQKKIIGLKIKKIQINSPKSFIGNPSKIEGKNIVGVWRRAKLLGIDLNSSLRAPKGRGNLLKQIASSTSSPRNDNNVTLLFHLKMSGQLIYDDGNPSTTLRAGRFIGGHPTPSMVGKMPNSHTRVIFSFYGGSYLYFNDQRKFGWVRVSEKGKVKREKFFEKLGPEPLEKEFTWQILKQNLLKHKSMPVKVAIMDQTVVAGVGNIYASEACFLAGFDPTIKIGELTDEQFKKLHAGVIKSLKKGIKYGGSTRVHFVDPQGHRGYFLDYAFVYGRDKHSCKVCTTEIKKITLRGRGTYFCPKCQK